jgi:hypothetical protein
MMFEFRISKCQGNGEVLGTVTAATYTLAARLGAKLIKPSRRESYMKRTTGSAGKSGCFCGYRSGSNCENNVGPQIHVFPLSNGLIPE